MSNIYAEEDNPVTEEELSEFRRAFLRYGWTYRGLGDKTDPPTHGKVISQWFSKFCQPSREVFQRVWKVMKKKSSYRACECCNGTGMVPIGVDRGKRRFLNSVHDHDVAVIAKRREVLISKISQCDS